jgi:hypothetical protein
VASLHNKDALVSLSGKQLPWHLTLLR